MHTMFKDVVTGDVVSIADILMEKFGSDILTRRRADAVLNDPRYMALEAVV